MNFLKTKRFSGDGLRVILTLACVVVVLAGLKAASTLIITILLAVFLAIVSYPLTKLLMRIRLPRFLAVFITVIIDCGFLVGIAFLVNFMARDLARTLQTKYYPLAMEKYGELVAFLNKYELEGALDGVGEIINGQRVMSISSLLVSTAASWLSLIVLVLILMTFFLSETDVYLRNLRNMSRDDGPNFSKSLKASADIQRYLLIKTAISFTTGLLAGILCYIMGVDFPLLWGIVAFALNFIPTIGSIVASIPPILLALLVLSPMTAIVVALGYLAINTCLGTILEPMLMGRQFGIATAVVLLSVLFWGWIMGPIGMLLAVPLTMIIKLAFENSRDFSWVATLISDGKEIPEEVEET